MFLSSSKVFQIIKDNILTAFARQLVIIVIANQGSLKVAVNSGKRPVLLR